MVHAGAGRSEVKLWEQWVAFQKALLEECLQVCRGQPPVPILHHVAAIHDLPNDVSAEIDLTHRARFDCRSFDSGQAVSASLCCSFFARYMPWYCCKTVRRNYSEEVFDDVRGLQSTHGRKRPGKEEATCSNCLAY